MHLPPPITSRTNARVKALRAALAGRASAPGEMAAIEGEHLLGEAAQAGVALETLFVRAGDEASLRSAWLGALQTTERVVLSRDVFDAAMDTATPQGLAGTFRIPLLKAAGEPDVGPVLILENLQDPGNVGTLVRSAAAFGVREVLLVGECANPWSPKVLRSSAGAVFRVPVGRVTLDAVKRRVKPRRVFAAVAAGNGASMAMDVTLQAPALMVGNEGRGLTSEALSMADELVTIPCRIESFNAAVAGSLLLYEAFRQVYVASRPAIHEGSGRALAAGAR